MSEIKKLDENEIHETDSDVGEERLYSNFVQDIIDKDNLENVYGHRVHTRFPPEPNGYLHIGHAKSICLNFGLANQNNGLCNLRFDDTNPSKEDTEYVDSIMEDVRWLGFDWDDRMFYASDYFDKIYGFAVELIKRGKAFVCSLTMEEMREYRGTPTQPGKNSPSRDRSVEENLDLFERMKNGEFPDGSMVVRAKIDMASPNFIMRDPVIYRNLRATHHRTGDKWCIYPMYDFAHPISDYLEGITHSICTLEFQSHRPLYDWCLRELGLESPPKQIEFARLNLNYTVMSKRKLLELVKNNYVNGWDDPRMPTISGLRRRGYTPESIRNFCSAIGVAKVDSTVDIGMLEHFIREDLNKKANRVMAVLRPLKVIIDNYPENQVEEILADNNPENPEAGTRTVPFSREIYIEEEDFMENPPKKYFRLYPGGEVRLKHTYYIKCESIIKDSETGKIIEIHCTYDPETKGGSSPDGRKVKGTIQWVSKDHAVNAEVRLYDHLFINSNPGEEGTDYKEFLNPDSLEVLTNVKLEPSLAEAAAGEQYQFIRIGYFCPDNKESTKDKLIFNRTVSLKDSWTKVSKL
jgi:glutaminyl-tRNA synthetase